MILRALIIGTAAGLGLAGCATIDELGSFAPVMRTHFFGALALALSDESYKRILVQELSNLLLGEMQTWAVSCAGACAELKDADGLLPSHLLQGEELPVTTLDVSKAECSKMA